MIARMLWITALFVALTANAADSVQVAQQRRTYLRDLLTDSASLVASLRKGCVRGMAPELQRESLQRGRAWSPDATDSCVMVLTRHGRDGALDAMYRTILLEQVKDDTGASTLAGEIGSYVVTYKSDRVPLARGVALVVTTALAFDAGFTNGYRDTKQRASAGRLPTEAALKPLAERCLGLTESNVQGCYSAGYVFGLRAASGELVQSAR